MRSGPGTISQWEQQRTYRSVLNFIAVSQENITGRKPLLSIVYCKNDTSDYSTVTFWVKMLNSASASRSIMHLNIVEVICLHNEQTNGFQDSFCQASPCINHHELQALHGTSEIIHTNKIKKTIVEHFNFT